MLRENETKWNICILHKQIVCKNVFTLIHTSTPKQSSKEKTIKQGEKKCVKKKKVNNSYTTFHICSCVLFEIEHHEIIWSI